MTAALARILRGEALHVSERQKRLLTYLVEAAVAGRPDRFKARSIATAILGRGDRFDPQLDPVVRIEISHLRRSLERYYLADGKADEFKLVIPKRNYAPRLETTPPATASAQKPRWVNTWARFAPVLAALVILVAALSLIAWPPAPEDGSDLGTDFGPSLRIDGVLNVSGDAALDPFAQALTADLTSAMARFKSLAVYIPAAPRAAASVPVDYRLRGTVMRLDNEIRVATQVVDAGTNRIVWSTRYSTAPGGSAHDALDVAQRIAGALGDPYGLLFMDARPTESMARDVLGIRNCMLNFYVYVDTQAKELFDRLLRCHENAVRLVPRYGFAWAQLALLDIDEYKYVYTSAPGAAPPLDRAVDAARHAIAVDPSDGQAHLALALAAWFRHDYESFSSEADRALALNASDPVILYEVGLRRYLNGDRTGGTTLVKQALTQGSGRPARYHDVLMLDAYLTGDYPRALEEATIGHVGEAPLARALVVAVLGKLGRREDAAALWGVFARDLPRVAADPRAVMLQRLRNPEIADALMSGLYEAGVVARPPAGLAEQSAKPD